MTMTKTKKLTDVCCERFFEAYLADEISFAYEEYTEIDETEWYIGGIGHLYCPFCGTFIKGRGFGTYDGKDSKTA
jgi:hypothetical protein